MTAFKVNTSGGLYGSPILSATTLSNGGFAIVWGINVGGINNRNGLYVSRYDAKGNEVGDGEVQVMISNSVTSPSIAALDDGGFIIVYTCYYPITQGDTGIYAQKYDSNGNQVSKEIKVSIAEGVSSPTIATLSNGSFVVSWVSTQGINAKSYDTSGKLIGHEFQVAIKQKVVGYVDSGFTSPQNPQIASLGNEEFVITWQESIQGNINVYAQMYDANNKPLGNTFMVNYYDLGQQFMPSIAALSTGGFVITWQSGGGGSQRTNPISSTQDGSGYGIYAQIYDASGNEIAEEFRVNTYTPNNQTNPKLVALSTGGFIITWISDDGKKGIYAREYDVYNNPVSREFKVNTIDAAPGSVLQSPTIASLNNGGFVITYVNSNFQTSNYEIYAQRYDANCKTVDQGVTIPLPNTAPVSQALALIIDQDTQITINFKDKISDAEDTVATLKLRLKSLPTCGTLYDVSDRVAVLNQLYTVNALKYNPSGCTASSVGFLYSAVNTHGLESNQSIVTIAIQANKFFPTMSSAVYNGDHHSNDTSTIINSATQGSYDKETQQISSIDSVICAANQQCNNTTIDNIQSESLIWKVLGITGWTMFLISTTGLYIIYSKYKQAIQDSNKNNYPNSDSVQLRALTSAPIGVSLEKGREIELIQLEDSKIYFNYGSGLVKTSWIGNKDALLVYDYNQSGQVDDSAKIVLTMWSIEAKTDFQALLHIFDSNQDRVFDHHDVEFNKFFLWQDKNQNGISDAGELVSLSEVGLQSIDFNSKDEMLNTANVYWEDGRITQAYDLVFLHE